MIAEVVGNYRLIERIGRGGMGEVYRAEHRRMPRRVAIKVLLPELSGDPALLERFFMEARSTAVLEHPGIVKIIDCDVHEGRAFMVMEYLEGESLSARLQREGRFSSWLAAVDVGRQIAQAVAAAHAKNIVHRDLKPDNIFLVREAEEGGHDGGDEDGQGPAGALRVKILDFGVAKLVIDGATLRTRDGALLGTPAYMAPEQCRDARSVDRRADIYSVGCILFEMLAGRPPFVARGFGELISLHLSEVPPSIATLNEAIPAALADLVGQMLAKRADARPQSMVEVGARLAMMTVTAALRGTDVRTLVLNSDETDVPWRPRLSEQPTTAVSGFGTGTLVAPADWSERPPRVRRTTTLSQAVGEVSALGTLGARKPAAPRRARRSWRLAVPAIGLLAACIAVAIVAGARRSLPVEGGEPSAAVVPADSPSSPIAPVSPSSAPEGRRDTSPPVVQDEVLVDVAGGPDALEVTADGHQVSLPLRWLRGSDQHHLLFKANGYRDKALTVTANRSRLIDLQMQRLSPRPGSSQPEVAGQLAAPVSAAAAGAKPRARPAPPTSVRPVDTAQVPAGASTSYDPDAVAKPAWAR